MGDVILSAENMRKKYKGRTALDGISFEIRRGTIYGLIGPDGAGKTSVLRALLGLIRLDEGSVTWHISKRDVGAAVDMPSFHRELNIRANLEAQANLLAVKPDKNRIPTLMKRMNIDEYRAGGRAMRHLLTNQKQSAALAMAIIGSPELLLLDEPLVALNIDDRVAFHKLFSEEYPRGKTALMTAQDASELEGFATEFIYIEGGRNV